jgi:bla regulator protein BlaR1
MMPDNLMSSPFLYNLSLTLIHFIWQGVFVALALKLALSVTSYKRPQWRYAFSSFAMIANLILPIVTFFVIYQPDFKHFSPLLNNSILLNDVINNNTQNTAVWYANIVEFLPYLSVTWVVISFALAVKLFIELYNVNQLPKTGTSPADPVLEARFHQLIEQVKLKCTPRILISLKNDVPMAIGWLKPVVLIPVTMLSGLTPAQLDMLILHELAHIRRHDYLVNFLQTLVEVFLFFHPGVRWVSKQMRNEREYCSDDIAVQHCGNPVAYAHTLADTASICNSHRHHSIPAMAMAASGGDLKQRVIRLIDQNHHCSTTKNSGRWLASIAIILSIIAVAGQKYIHLPVFDISSGTISLYRNANDNINNYKAVNNNLSLPALAKHLLHNEEEETLTVDSLPLVISKDTVTLEQIIDTKNLENMHIIASNTTQNMITDNTLNQRGLTIDPASMNALDTPQNQASVITEEIVMPMFNKSINIKAQKKALRVENISSLNAVTHSVTNPLSKPLFANKSNIKKSMSEQAFDRTDSTKINSALNNPYAKQVADLTGELILESSPLALELARENTIEQVLSIENTEINTYRYDRYPAQLLSSVSPKYPSNAKRKGIEIDIHVTFTIDKDGYVRDIQYNGKGKVNYFRSTIRSALEKWRFTPANYNNQSVESSMTKIFSFSLEK